MNACRMEQSVLWRVETTRQAEVPHGSHVILRSTFESLKRLAFTHYLSLLLSTTVGDPYSIRKRAE